MISYPNVKINLGLNILSKRDDGFHNIETVFIPFHRIYDRLEIILGEDYSRISSELFEKYSQPQQVVQAMSEDGKLFITIAREEGIDWNPLNDLCAKAYYLLDKDFVLPPVKIFLEKLSPIGAGLGGGSSDAAFALKMLSDLCDLNLSQEQLVSYASKLGSDCAFFIYNRPMLGQGRGEILSEIEFNNVDYGQKGGENSSYKLEIVSPKGISVSTADAYAGVSPAIPEKRIEEILVLPLKEWQTYLYNDFEKSVFKKYTELKNIKASLYLKGAIYAAMSGSGSSLFFISDATNN